MYNIDNGSEENGQVNCLHLFILSERLQNEDRELYGLSLLAIPDYLGRDTAQQLLAQYLRLNSLV